MQDFNDERMDGVLRRLLPDISRIHNIVRNMCLSDQDWFSDPESESVLSYEFLVRWALELPVSMPQGQCGPRETRAIQKMTNLITLADIFGFLRWLHTMEPTSDEIVFNNILAWRCAVPTNLFDSLWYLYKKSVERK